MSNITNIEFPETGRLYEGPAPAINWSPEYFCLDGPRSEPSGSEPYHNEFGLAAPINMKFKRVESGWAITHNGRTITTVALDVLRVYIYKLFNSTMIPVDDALRQMENAAASGNGDRLNQLIESAHSDVTKFCGVFAWLRRLDARTRDMSRYQADIRWVDERLSKWYGRANEIHRRFLELHVWNIYLYRKRQILSVPNSDLVPEIRRWISGIQYGDLKKVRTSIDILERSLRAAANEQNRLVVHDMLEHVRVMQIFHHSAL